MDGIDLPSRWLDDYTEGEVFDLPGDHLMTEERILEFAAEFDPQPFHTDPEAAAESIYGGLIASGWHTGSVMMRLLTSALGPASLGSPGCDSLRWVAPVRPGDRLSLRVTVLEVRPSSSKPDRGSMRWRNEVRNQRGETVMTIEAILLLRRQPSLEASSSA